MVVFDEVESDLVFEFDERNQDSEDRCMVAKLKQNKMDLWHENQLVCMYVLIFIFPIQQTPKLIIIVNNSWKYFDTTSIDREV